MTNTPNIHVGPGMSSIPSTLPSSSSHNSGVPAARSNTLCALSNTYPPTKPTPAPSAMHHQPPGLGDSPGPFSCPKSPHHAAFWTTVLRVASCRNTPNLLLAWPDPSLFSVRPAGSRSAMAIETKSLRRPVHRQPCSPTRLELPTFILREIQNDAMRNGCDFKGRTLRSGLVNADDQGRREVRRVGQLHGAGVFVHEGPSP